MEKRKLIDENGKITPFEVMEFDSVIFCVLSPDDDWNLRTKDYVVLDEKFYQREALIEGLISGEVKLPVMEPGGTLELRMFKGDMAYCIEIGNKTSDVSDEWCFFTQLPDEGKRFAIENLADVTTEWWWSALKEEHVGVTLDWETFVTKYMVNVERGLEIKLTSNKPINQQIDEASFIFEHKSDLSEIAEGIAGDTFKLVSNLKDQPIPDKVREIVEERRKQVDK